MVRAWTGIFLLAAAWAGAAPLTGPVWSAAEQGLYTLALQGSGPGALQIVDRAAGTIATLSLSQDAGQWSASANLLVEPADYQLRWDLGPGVTARAEVFPYTPVTPLAQAPELPEGIPVRTSLVDRQSAVWKITVKPDRPRLILSIRGRNIGRVVLWKDRVWDQGISFGSASHSPLPGRPMGFYDLDQNVEPGEYLLQVFGAPQTVWTGRVPDSPLVVGRGADFLAVGALRQGVLDAEGRAEVLVGQGAAAVEAQLEGPGEADLSLGASLHSLTSSSHLAAKDNSRFLSVGAGGSARWAVLQGPPGTRYSLRAVPGAYQEVFSLRGNTPGALLAGSESLRSGDGYPVTGVALQLPDRTVGWNRTLTLDPDHPVHLATNNQSSASVYIQVKAAGTYAIVEKSGAADYQFDLLDDLVAGSGRPLRVKANGAVPLQAKVYRVTSSPVKPGRLEWALLPAGLGQGLAASALWDRATTSLPGAWTTVLGPLDARKSWHVRLGTLEGTAAPVSVLELPVAAERLPSLTLEGGQTLALSVRAPRSLWGGWSSSAPVKIDGTNLAPGGLVPAGDHVVTLTAASPQAFPWKIEPLVEGEVPVLRVATPGLTLWDDWKTQQTRTFELQVSEPGLYRLETEGRLSTRLQVRSPLQRNLFSAGQNAGGTNSRVWAFLNPGRYRVDVRAEDGTAGRAGLSLLPDLEPLVRTLVPGTEARATVPPEKPLRIDVQVASAGPYLLSAVGLNQTFVRRLEDSAGYPVDGASVSGGGRLDLIPGSYRLWSYPLPGASRRTYALELLPGPDAPGEGLRWGQTVTATWKESPSRAPQVYTLGTEAPVKAQLRLSEGMIWEVLGPDGTLVDRGLGGEPVTVSLPKGKNQIAVRSRAVDNLKEYSLSAVTLDLTPGRSIVLPEGSVVPLVVDEEATYEIKTWGSREVPLALTTETGALVARGVPRTDDWNSSLFARLKPGRYLVTLQESPGPLPEGPAPETRAMDSESEGEGDYEESDYGEGDYEEGGYEDGYGEGQDAPPAVSVPAWTPWTEARFPGDVGGSPLLQFAARPEKPASAPSVGFPVQEVWDDSILVRTFTPPEAGVYRFSSPAGRLTVFRLEKEGAVLAQKAGGFAIPLKAGVGYRLSSWWEDGNPGPVTWSVSRAADVVLWTSADRTSARIETGKPVEASPDWEIPLSEAPDGWLSPRGTQVWWTGAPGTLPRPVSLQTGGALAIPVGGEGRSVGVTVPAGQVGVLWARGAGSEVGLSLHQGPLPAEWDWNQAAIRPRESVVAAGPGPYTARVWTPETGPTAKSVDLEWRTFPTSDLPPSVLAGSLNPGTAVVLKPKFKALRFVLDAGLVAFPWGSAGAPLAADSASSGVLTGTAWAVVNPTDRPLLWRAVPSSPAPSTVVTETAAWEQWSTEEASDRLEVRGAAGFQVYVQAAGAGSVRFVSAETGRTLAPKVESGPAGTRWTFPASKGQVWMEGWKGYARVWTGPAASPEAGIGASGSPKGTLGVEGSVLPPSASQWTFTPGAAGFYAFSADGPGLLAVTGKEGKVLGTSWSTTQRLVLVRLGTDAVTVVARPFDREAQAGRLGVQPLAPETGPEALAAPGEKQLWAVPVTAPGRVGIGVRSSAEGMLLTLFDPGYVPLAQGRLFWRSLVPGTYWLVVEGGSATQRYRPLFYGLEGSRTGIPDEIRAQYSQGNDQ